MSLSLNSIGPIESKEIQIFRTFEAVNTGDLELVIQTVTIDDKSCQGYGFLIQPCEFSLNPGETKKIQISFMSQTTQTILSHKLYFVSTEEVLTFPLIAIFPYQYTGLSTNVQAVTAFENDLLLFSAFSILTVFFLLVWISIHEYQTNYTKYLLRPISLMTPNSLTPIESEDDLIAQQENETASPQEEQEELSACQKQNISTQPPELSSSNNKRSKNAQSESISLPSKPIKKTQKEKIETQATTKKMNKTDKESNLQAKSQVPPKQKTFPEIHQTKKLPQNEEKKKSKTETKQVSNKIEAKPESTPNVKQDTELKQHSENTKAESSSIISESKQKKTDLTISHSTNQSKQKNPETRTIFRQKLPKKEKSAPLSVETPSSSITSNELTTNQAEKSEKEKKIEELPKPKRKEFGVIGSGNPKKKI